MEDFQNVKGLALIDISILLNDKEVKWNSIDIYSLFFKSIDCSTNWETGISFYSAFEPFSCSCGQAGCAGIWDGIYVKNRKHSIEWRAKKQDGYKFLDKTFYSFSKEQYLFALRQLHKNILFLTEVLGDKFVIDTGYSEGDETTGKQFLDFIDKEIRPDIKFW